jgi:phage gpG-like protein
MVSVSIDNTKALKALGNIADVLRNQKEYKIFNNLANVLARSWWAETFELQGARRGHDAWVPLSEAYYEYKLKNGFGLYNGEPWIMVGESGHLQASPEIVEEGLDYLSFGTKVPYAHFHQEGGEIPGRPPQRELFFVTDQDKAEMKDWLVGYLTQVLGKQIEDSK